MLPAAFRAFRIESCVGFWGEGLERALIIVASVSGNGLAYHHSLCQCAVTYQYGHLPLPCVQVHYRCMGFSSQEGARSGSCFLVCIALFLNC